MKRSSLANRRRILLMNKSVIMWHTWGKEVCIVNIYPCCDWCWRRHCDGRRSNLASLQRWRHTSYKRLGDAESSWTMQEAGSNLVEIVGKDAKRQITAVFGCNMSGDFLPPKLVYQDKTKWCLPDFQFLHKVGDHLHSKPQSQWRHHTAVYCENSFAISSAEEKRNHWFSLRLWTSNNWQFQRPLHWGAVKFSWFQQRECRYVKVNPQVNWG